MFIYVGVATDDVGTNAAVIEAASRSISFFFFCQVMPGDMYIHIFILI